MNKYRNKKTEVDGIVFDSKMESNYYRYLLDEKEKGRVVSIALQPSFELIPRFLHNGCVIRKMVYKADFLVVYSDESCVVIDVKGVKTQVFNLKKKLFHYRYPNLKLVLVRQSGKKWVEIK